MRRDKYDRQAYLVGMSRVEQQKRRKALLEKLDFRVHRPEKVSVQQIVSQEAQSKSIKLPDNSFRSYSKQEHIEIVSLLEFARKKKLCFELEDDNKNKFLLILKAVK